MFFIKDNILHYLFLMTFFSFDLQLESFGVNPNEFKQTVMSHIFNAFVEPWEVENCKKKTVWLSKDFLLDMEGFECTYLTLIKYT